MHEYTTNDYEDNIMQYGQPNMLRANYYYFRIFIRICYKTDSGFDVHIL